MGKSALVESLRNRVMKRGDIFLTGKFDLIKRNIPYAALFDALSELPEQIEEKNIENGGAIREKIGLTLCKVIVRCIPSLWPVLFPGEDQPAETEDSRYRRLSQMIGSAESRNQFNFAFQMFIRSLCEVDDSILVLFIDDLQCEFTYLVEPCGFIWLAYNIFGWMEHSSLIS